MKAGTLEIEFMTNLARIQGELTTIKRAVGQTMGEAVRTHNQAEREALRFVEALEDEARYMGLSAREAKALQIEMKALAAEQAGFNALATRIRTVGGTFSEAGKSAGAASGNLRQFAIQLPDIAQGLLTGQKPMTLFVQQGGQLAQVAMAAEGGMLGFARGVAAAALPFAPFIIAAGAAYAALRLVTSNLTNSGEIDAYAKSLGLTQEQMGKLTDVSVTFGDVMAGVWKTVADASQVDETFKAVGQWAEGLRDRIAAAIKQGAVWMYSQIAGTYDAVILTWRQWPGAIADLFIQGANKAIMAINWLARGANAVFGKEIFGQIKPLENAYAGAGAAVGDAYNKAVAARAAEGNRVLTQLGANIIASTKARLKAQADALRSDPRVGSSSSGSRARETKELEDQLENQRVLYQFDAKLRKEMEAEVARATKDGWSEVEEAVQGFTEARFLAAREAMELYKQSLGALVDQMQSAGDDFAHSWGRIGGSIADALDLLSRYGRRQSAIADQLADQATDEKTRQNLQRESAQLQLSTLVGLTGAAKGFFKENSAGYKAMAAAEKALTLIQLARTAVDVAGGAARMFATLGPLAFPAVGAMLAVMASLGFSGGGNAGALPKSNEGKGTVFGDDDAQSKSIERAIDLLRDVDTLTMTYSRDMLASLRSIENNIGGLTNLLIRTGNIDASAGVDEGFESNALGKGLGTLFQGAGLLKNIPIIGDFFGGLSKAVQSLFGTKTKVIGSGLYGGDQTLADIMSGGFDASYYSDVKKTKKFFGVSAGSKYKTSYTDASDEIESQFTLLLSQFADAIAASAGPLGQATDQVEQRLAGFVVHIGKIDLKDLSGEEIQEKLSAVFGAAADDMARAAIPGLEKFQKVGEGYFETLVRVGTTMETVSVSLGRLGANAQNLSIDASMGLAGMFDSLSDLTGAADSYFEAYFTDAEQAAIKTAQLGKAFDSIGVAMPDSIAGFRALVEAQDLTTASGQQTYATLLQLAPAFAEISTAAQSASSAAAIARERADLEKQYLELMGDEVTLKQMQLDELAPSNRELQQNIWALKEAQAAQAEAAKAAEDLAQAEKARADALVSAREELERRINGLLDDTATARQRELEAMDASLRPLQERYNAIVDEQTAAAAAAQAQKELADQRAGLERQVLEALGDEAAIRQLELAALPESLRVLQERVWAINAEKAAMEEASRVAAEAAQAAAQAAAEAQAKVDAINSQRDDLTRQIWDLTGNEAAIRAADLEKALDPANRALMEQIYALKDQQASAAAATQQQAEMQKAAEDAAKAADQLREAWSNIADSLLDEVKRIRGLTGGDGVNFAMLQGQFNVATAAARAGDQDAAKLLPGLSKQLLDLAADVATSRQELDRVQAVTAASLEETARRIGGVSTAAMVAANSAESGWWQAAAASTSMPAANDGGASAEVASLKAEIVTMREELVNALEQVANQAGRGSDVLVRTEKLGNGDGLAVSAREAA